MGYNFPIYRPHGIFFFAILAALLTGLVLFLFLFVAETAFTSLGFTRLEAVLILIATLLGSYVNIPLWKIRGQEQVWQYQEVQVFWVTYRIPNITIRDVSTLIAVNLGGAIIPILVSAYLLATHPSTLIYAAAGIILTSIIVHAVARKVPGVGIVTPALLPPIVAALAAYLLLPSSPGVVAYASGTLGTLIGADLSNLGGIKQLGAPVASIGGAGKFDGVFLTGILAVLLV